MFKSKLFHLNLNMLSDFIYSINCVLPLFAILLLGLFLRGQNILDHNATLKINAIVFNVALPAMLFRDISGSDFMVFFDLSFIAFCLATTLLMFLMLFIVGAVAFKDKKRAGAFIQGCFRGNYVIIGLPIIYNILGRPSGIAVLNAAFTVPLYNILSIVALSYGGAKRGGAIKGAFVNIAKNPIIIGILLGVIFSVSGLINKMPVFLKASISYLANLTTPLALLAIGAALTLKNIRATLGASMCACALKLIVCPLVFLFIASFFNFSGEATVALYVMYGAPSAVSTYIMSDIMGCDSDLSANIVMSTTALSVFTFTAFIFAFKVMNII